ncbi:hypothetical protein H1V43_21080 [Streptomyces sp. PSKA54]|uniref:Uncharacterized protein n=1 Tax=Streptomyces himalayensis subsp. aureolus TaxID=2758039 RepID=A0A7W2D382_9ACTN|nr:hypothetical protein [Streptomyces himalayensis]MBA4863814.1 hypothetical protein [Streptomyces himalayensis subsp. aureolus]
MDGAHLAWPASAAAATAELAELARDLADAGVAVQWHPDGVVLPDLASGPGDTAGIRVHTTRRAPHALYVITATLLVPFTHAAGALAYLRPLIDAAARSCDGCCAEPGPAELPAGPLNRLTPAQGRGAPNRRPAQTLMEKRRR